ncbi:hypothetical protein [Xanthobacter sp. KR7-225]|uniref:hypothetical protein n=1 Tax=Xanthobacter sp. KR7-225 TaxID=3156613 RepID=UPI0032B3926A
MRRHGHMRGVIGLLAAYGLVAQAFLLALMLGASATPASFAALCAPSRALSADGDTPLDRPAHLPDCCLVGSCGVSGALGGAPAAALPAPAAFAPALYSAPDRADAPRAARAGDARARAPPSA